jgi:hypothetical protein
MKKVRPTSINAVAWFFIFFGTLGSISATGNLIIGGADLLLSIERWPVYLQLLVGLFLVYGGNKLLNGSSLMRKYLEGISYMLILILFLDSISNIDNFGYKIASIIFMLYLVPLALVIRVLRSDAIRD